MISSKSEKSSRRSSILKLPKIRQPFQSVEANGSPAEDTPMKQKRRVSFAEKKHVKEFCDSMEQGTVWDSTYEESELSHTKVTLQTNIDDNSHIQVLSEISNALNYQSSSRETSVVVHHQSRKVLIRQNAIDLDHLPVEAIRNRLEPGDINHTMMSVNPELLANKENIPAVLKLSVVESSLIEDDELIFGQRSQQNSNSRGFSVYCDDNIEDENENNLLNKTDHQDISMDCTLPATDSILSSNIDNAVNSQLEINNSDGMKDKTRVFHENNAMEMTEAVGSVFSMRIHEVPNGTTVSQNRSMEMTQVVPSSYPRVSYSNTRMNDTMEFTQVVPPSSKIQTQQQMVNASTQRFRNQFTDVPEILPSKCPESFFENRTQVFHDKSMEITVAIPSVRSGPLLNETQLFHDKSGNITETMIMDRPKQFEDGTHVFSNKSMEMTEAIPSVCPIRLMGEKTRIFQDTSMEMTEAVPVEYAPNRSQYLSGNRNDECNDKSMEMTEVVPSIRSRQFLGNNTQIFHNHSMEMTEAVPMMPISQSSRQPCGDRTEVFSNRSMELTESVSSGGPAKILGDKTVIFDDDLVEMTEAVPPLPPGRFLGNATRVLHDNSMEMTGAVTPLYYPKHNTSTHDNRTQLFHNKSMEITAAVTNHQPSSMLIQHDNPNLSRSIMDDSNRTQIFTNYCMEHTEVIPSLKRQYQQISNENNKSDSGCSSPNAKSLRNDSVQQEKRVSEADRAALRRFLHRNLNESSEKPVLPSSALLNCHNQSMEMTVAIPAHFNQRNSPIQNVSMEITEVIQSIPETANPTIDIQEDVSSAPNSRKYSEDTNNTRLSLMQIPSPAGVSFNGNMNDSIEQLRFRASSVSNASPEDITYDLTVPIRTRNLNKEMTNVLEEVEAPSFVFANISDDMPVLAIEERIEQDEPMPLPEISITEDIDQIGYRRRTYVMNSHGRVGCTDTVVENNESFVRETSETLRKSPIEFNRDIGVDEEGDVDVCPETDSRDKETAAASWSCVVGSRRRTYIVDRNEDEATMEKRGTTRCDSTTYAINPTMNEDHTGGNNDEVGINGLNEHRPRSPSGTSVEPSTQLKRVGKVNISPVKEINFEFDALAENDLIIARIEKQERIKAAMAFQRNVEKANKDQLESQGPVVSKASIIEEQKSRYDILVERLNEIANKHGIIWRINTTSPNIIRIAYCMTALLLEIVFNVPDHPNELEIIDRVQLIPRMSKKEKAILRMTDRLIVQKIDVENLRNNYKTYDDVLNLIEYVTKEVNSIFSFYHELKRLSCVNSMIVAEDKVSFRVWTRKMNIILNITMNIKPFTDIQPEDIDVTCLLGSIRVNDVKNLIRNIKRNHKFLTLYINDIKDFIELMEESTATRK